MTEQFTIAQGESASDYAAMISAWACEGLILEEQAFALIEEGRRREDLDPYEGTYCSGTPADAWEHVWGGRVWVVNVYRLHREYAGPEEGGWWRTVKDPEGIIAGPFKDVGEADEVAKHLQAFASLHDEGNMYSVRGGHEFFVQAESCVPHACVRQVYC